MAAEPGTTSADDATDRPLSERFGVLVGVGGGVFGVLSAFGLALLPVGTRGQAALVLTACAALGVACVTGVGAWAHRGRFVATAVAVAVALLSLAALAVVTESVTRSAADSAGRPAAPDAPAGASDGAPDGASSPVATTPPGGAPTGTPGASAPPTSATPTGAAAPDILKTGTAVLSPYGSENTLDLEANEAVWGGHAGDQYDAIASEDGLGALNGALFARWPRGSPPRPHECGGQQPGAWVTTIDLEDFERRSYFCVRSAERRLGYLQTRGFERFPNESVRGLRLTFVLWKSPGDR
jgi:hypothetical protein